ncbi:DUF4132 domain-containing protein [Massilia atriviolacea]|uniref:DUF4132 domain-containing protein n=1 Tax=Massilia atriviolacea TaxID=2495579 RepID=A0A430HTP6_9BURK|nr:DUF4132 domain-containing protein [Massilia atriviolacea]RSZ60926.1 DUF4132 domain-containing protein [Massilia atriviolacea]
MDGDNCFPIPLAAMAFDFGVDGAWVVAREIAARLRAGREPEVMAYLAGCDIALLRSLGRLGGGRAVWQQDDALWLRMARVTVGRQVLFTEAENLHKQRNAAFSADMRTLGQRCSGDAEGRRFVLDQIADLLPYPGMPLDEALALLDWILALRRKNGIADDNLRRRDGASLVACLASTADLIAAAARAACLCQQALDEYQRRSLELPAGQRWLPWHDFFAHHPDLYDKFHQDVPDPALILRRWPGASPAVRKDMGLTLLGAIADDHGLDAADQLMRRDEALFAALLQEHSAPFGVALSRLIWEKQYPALLPLLFPLMTETRRRIAEHPDTLRALLSSEPQRVLTALPGHLDLLIALLSPDQLRAILPQLGTRIAKTTSKAVRDAIVAASGHFAIDEMKAAGWFEVRSKNLRLACRDILLAHPDQAAATPLLEKMLASGGFDAAASSSLSAVLAPSGACSLAELETQAAAVTRWSTAIKPFEHAEVLALFQPLSEHAARAALHLAATGDDALPPLATALLAQLSADNRARLALHAVRTWTAGEGEPRLRWMLRLAADGADDRIVDPLAAAIVAWGKKARYPRALVAMAQLSALDSPYALLRVMEAAESSKLKDAVVNPAIDTLAAAARRRNCTVGELVDELSPDFGLAEGATLSAGAHSYRIALQDDLSLRLIDARGKSLKSLPANADSSRFAMLAAAVKHSARLQAPRMMCALMTGKSWSAPRWTRLFREHALLRIIGRSLIWQADGASFRIAEDFSLIRADDEPCDLAADARVTLWHPAGAQPGEAEAWRTHLADYRLAPLIDQTGAPAALPPAAQLSSDRLQAPAGLAVTYEHLAAILSKAGYREGTRAEGHSTDISWHAWPLRMAGLEVRVMNGACPPFPSPGTPVGVASVELRDGANDDALVPTADWPAALLATVWSQLLLLDAKRLA